MNSVARLLWFWGVAAIAAAALLCPAVIRRDIAAALCWVVIALIPYGFLTYMNRVPSRHTYLASAGLSFIVATGFVAIAERRRKSLVIGLVTAALVHNCGYLWTKKQEQYQLRARPTERLVQVYRDGAANVIIECFPYSMWIARYTVEIGAGRRWDENAWQIGSDCRPEEVRIRPKSSSTSPEIASTPVQDYLDAMDRKR
jgi:hypothetical protein